MPLFNARFLKKLINEPPAIPAQHRKILEAWSADISSHRIREISEDQIESRFFEEIIKNVLGYSGEGAEETWNSQPKVQMGSGRVDLALGAFDKTGAQNVAVPLELKGAKTRDLDVIMSGRNITPVQQAWQYAVANSGTKWIMVCNMVELRLYSYDRGMNEYESWELYGLTDPYQYAKLQRLLSPANLLGTETRRLLKTSRDADKEISEQLYADYKSLRGNLIWEIGTKRPDILKTDVIRIAQTILDRILFIAFAEDTGLLPEETLKKAYEFKDPYGGNVPAWTRFKALFEYIDKGNKAMNIPRYNGGLFKTNDLIQSLELSDSVMAGFKALGDYDFESEVRVTVLGRIFEQSITDLEELQAIADDDFTFEAQKAKGTTGRRKREGVIYTPDYVAEFIVEQSIGKRLKELFGMCVAKYAKKGDVSDYKNILWRPKKGKGNSALNAWQEYRKLISELKIVDPACGSGVFLVTAFDFLRAEYKRVNAKIEELQRDFNLERSMDFLDTDTEVLTNNLYGVDVNEESVEITKLSLWLKTARRGKVLDSLDNNILVGDSLIGDSNFAYHKHKFEWKTAFKDVPQGEFDIVLGNPPYVRQERLGAETKRALKNRYEVYTGVADLYTYFFERGIRQLKDGGRLGYICSSTFFKTSSGKPLRDYISKNSLIETMVDFGDHQIFEGVTTYPSVMVLKKGVPPESAHTQFWNIGDMPKGNFFAGFQSEGRVFDQNDLNEQAWTFESQALVALRRKLVSGRKTLKQVYGSPLYGIKTGRNEAFVIDQEMQNNLVRQDARSLERLKPWLVGKDLKKWRAEPQNQYLIFFPKGWTQEAYGVLSEVEAWENLKCDYPAIAEHIQQFADVCRKRTDQGDYWWELRACDYYDKFDEPKIIYPDLSQGPKFSLNNDCFAPNTTYFIPTHDAALLAILNAPPTWFFLRGVSDAMRGGTWRIRMFTQNIETIPIPELSEPIYKLLEAKSHSLQSSYNEQSLAQQSIIRRIPDLCPEGQTAKLTNKLKDWHKLPDFKTFRKEIKKAFKADIPLNERSDWEDMLATERKKISQLDGEIATAEAKINAIVYDLFNLTSKEIELIEANI